MSVIEDNTTQESEGERGSGSHRHKHRRSHHHHSSKREHRISTKRERESQSDQSVSKKRHRRNKNPSKMGCAWTNFLKSLLIVFHMILDAALEFGLGWYWGEKKQCPTLGSDDQKLCQKSAVELAQLIRERKLKAHDVVKAYIDRMKEVNPLLNAVVDGPFLEALGEAAEVDDQLTSGQLTEKDFLKKPFLGVPFTTKDSTSVKGKLLTLGLLSRRNEKSLVDAECVRLMKEAGAIIIATSNVPEVNKWIESRNSLIGQTNNPYDTRRSAGGSSGGEASLIASCATGFGLGTDIGGSIRIPSFNCGIFGHKPTVGVVNTRGCTFRTGKEADSMVVAGPMSRYATDLMPILRVIADPEKVTDLKLDEKVDLTKLRYFYIPNNGMPSCNPVNRDMQTTMFKVTRHFADLTGEEVTAASLPGTEISGRLFRYWLSREPANFNTLLGNGASLNPFVELFKKIVGRSEFTMGAILALLDGVLPSEKADRMEEATKKCSEALAELLGDDGVLFYHSAPRTAPFHYYPLVKIMDFCYFSIFNVLRVPATQVPMGLDSKAVTETGARLPVDVYTRVYVYFMQNLDANDLQFKMHALLQQRFVDSRLAFNKVAPSRTQPILGEMSLRDSLWVPHIFLANERDSSILGAGEKDILTSISPDGTVIISTRVQATLSCWMNLQMFPFDEQYCSTIFESWIYNTSELILHWEDKSPVTFDPDMHLTEYVFVNAWANETVVNADSSDLRHGAFVGNYSSLSSTVHLSREVGVYLMDYYLPSILIVSISWVSFWLQPDQTPARTTLGTSPMLAFITLASNQSQTLPEVNYVKVSEVWFLCCTLFIFGSLLEFAFVNNIWRRKKNAELKKLNSKYVLKSTLTTRFSRKEMGFQKSRSCSSLDGQSENNNSESNTCSTFVSVDNSPIMETTQCDDEFVPGIDNPATNEGKISNSPTMDLEKNSESSMSNCATICVDDKNNCFSDTSKSKSNSNHDDWTTMTPQEIALLIDRQARFIFPLAFLVFNAIFWGFIYC